MTNWQWSIVCALIRVVLRLESRTNHEYTDIEISNDCSLLNEALERNDWQ